MTARAGHTGMLVALRPSKRTPWRRIRCSRCMEMWTDLGELMRKGNGRCGSRVKPR